jgi:hypothetical protein
VFIHDGHQIAVSLETFSVQACKDALAKNRNNRPLSKNVVRLYKAAIERHEWMVNGETIIFDEDGYLANGQHRLTAALESGKPITSFVMRGVSKRAFETIDNVKRRAVSDVLAIDGKLNTHTLAAALRAIEFLMAGSYASRHLFTPKHALEVLDVYPNVQFWTTRYIGHKTARGLFPSSLVAVLTLSAEVFGSEISDEFLSQLDSGQGLAAGSPTLALRNRFIERGVGKTFSPEHAVAMMIKAMNAFANGRKIKTLRYSTGEEFPQLG